MTKKLLLFFGLLSTASAQFALIPGYAYTSLEALLDATSGVIFVAGVPGMTCSSGQTSFDTTNLISYVCVSGAWVQRVSIGFTLRGGGFGSEASQIVMEAAGTPGFYQHIWKTSHSATANLNIVDLSIATGASGHVSAWIAKGDGTVTFPGLAGSGTRVLGVDPNGTLTGAGMPTMVNSVNGRSGVVTLTSADVGLGTGTTATFNLLCIQCTPTGELGNFGNAVYAIKSGARSSLNLANSTLNYGWTADSGTNTFYMRSNTSGWNPITVSEAAKNVSLISPSLGVTPLTMTVTANAAGTTAKRLVVAVVNGTGTEFKTAAVSDGGLRGIALSTASSGSTEIAIRGQTLCTFENAAVANELVIAGTGTAGDCRSSGQTDARLVAQNVQVIGSVKDGGVAGDHTVFLFGPGHYGTMLSKLTPTATAPACAVTADVGNIWLDNTSAVTTHYKICAEVASAAAFVTVF